MSVVSYGDRQPVQGRYSGPMSFVRMLLTPLVLAGLMSGLGACSGKALNEVRGQIRDWTYGAGSAEFLDDDLKTLSTSTLDAVGRFNLKLPAEANMTPLLQESLLPELPAGCSNTVKASTPAARFYSLGDITAYPTSGQKNAYTLVSEERGGSNPVKVTRRLFIYASQDVSVRGTLSCPVNTQQASATYGLDLKKGWNRVASSQLVYDNGSSQTSIANTGVDGFERWSIAPAQ
jgi:hypothetical protein